MANSELYHQAVEIARDYLGPAGERFMSRQIQNHLEKPPTELKKEDLEKLAAWIKLSLAYLTEDSKLIREFTDRLASLAYTKNHHTVR
ncbi:MAG: hypothetical protein JWL85_917 [Candidatus Saccharibacteria bacterium]|nr:hypothetical protein [Candidatus Saccharibacteria bacterium]